MSLIGALNTGKTALAVHQAAIQVTSNNVANAGNPNYTRQVATSVPGRDVQSRTGLLIGSGVNLTSIERQIDSALEQRIRGSVADGEAAATQQQWLGRVESIFHELGDDDLSSQLSAFFNAWSNLANTPGDNALRQVVLQTGQTVAGTLQTLRGNLSDLQGDIDKRLNLLASDANGLAQQVADLNEQIALAEGSTNSTANALRDQRDGVLKQLSELIDVKVQETGPMVNVLVGSEPLVLGTTNLGISFDLSNSGGSLVAKVSSNANGGTLPVSSGQMGALIGLRSQIDTIAADLDSLAGGMIFELNKLHASGQGLEGFTEVTGTYAVADNTAALNSAGLPFAPTNGSFVVHVRDTATGLVTSTLVQVDLDGLNGDDTTLASLATKLNSITGVSASIVGGKLKLQSAGSQQEISFSQDSSGALAALGINTFFTGSTAADIAVNSAITSKPTLLAAAANGEKGDNQTALAIAQLESRAIKSLNGSSLSAKYQSMITQVAVAVDNARTSAQSAAAVQETLLNQREALSGVSLDEEAINLMREQRAFQGAARIIAAVDELMQTLLQLV